MDVWAPAKQYYLDQTDPVHAAAYRKQRREDELLYQRGLCEQTPSARRPQLGACGYVAVSFPVK